MKKKILEIAVVLMVVAMLATPFVGTVMAKEKVYAELITTGQSPVTPGEVWVTKSGIQQERGTTRTFYHILTIGEDSYPLVSVNTINARFDLETGYFVGHYDAVWYISTEGSDSGFKGMSLGKLYDFDTSGAFPPFSRAVIQCTMQGFGDFEGQTLKFSVDGDFFEYIGTWTGYCIK